jgi:steroid 5-alpha reductase family enzyme
MPNFEVWIAGLLAMLVAAGAGWVYSVVRRNVTIVDSLWPLLFVIAAFVYAERGPGGARTQLLLVLVTLWGLRLAARLNGFETRHARPPRVGLGDPSHV